MPRAKPQITRATMRAKAYPVLCSAVESGVACGWNRAHKHDPHPAEEVAREAIERAVLDAICEAFDFPEDDERG